MARSIERRGLLAVGIGLLGLAACGASDSDSGSKRDAGKTPPNDAALDRDATSNPSDAGTDVESDAGNGSACVQNECSDAELDAGADGSTCSLKQAHVLADNQSPRAIAVDSTYAYWVNDAPSQGGIVNKVPLCGGPVTILVPGGGQFQQTMAIAVDATSVYWTDGVAGTLNKVSIDGGEPVKLASFEAMGSLGPNEIALDADYVYFPITLTSGTIARVPKSGGDPTTLVSGQYNPRSLVIDSANLFWTNNAYPDAGVTGGTVNQAPLGGGTATPLAPGEISPYGITVDATSVYFTTSSAVKKVPIAGGAITTLSSNEDFPWAVVVDTTDAYFTSASKIRKVPIEGGSVTTIADGLGSAVAMAIDSTSVYWASLAGQLSRISK